MAHTPRRERIAQVVACCLNSSTPLSVYGIARALKMSVSNHLYSIVEQAREMDLIEHEDVERTNGKWARYYATSPARVRRVADTEMLNTTFFYSGESALFESEHSEIPF